MQCSTRLVVLLATMVGVATDDVWHWCGAVGDDDRDDDDDCLRSVLCCADGGCDSVDGRGAVGLGGWWRAGLGPVVGCVRYARVWGREL